MIRSRPWLMPLLLIPLAAAILLAMGRPPICTCGYVSLWVSSPASAETSQMLADWYSMSHLVHGFLFFGLLWLVARRFSLPTRLAIAIVVEAAWEIAENSPWIIDRYRSATAAVGYSGDSVLNSVSDIAMMAIGFLVARRLPLWASVATVIALELIPLAAIRDNLTLNIIMLVHPIDAIRTWQAAAI
jgi:hypothetical protein